MTFEFKEAHRENVSVLIGLAGASGSGKTKSALELATGLAGPNGRIVMLDTESKRGLHYAPAVGVKADPSQGTYRFHHDDLLPPFPPEKFADAVDRYSPECDVMIFDSFSHSWEGEGGLRDIAAELEKKGAKGPAAWANPKDRNKKMVNKFLQARCHLIFCLRADEKIEMVKHPDTGKLVVRPLGWTPICEKRFMYEMTASFTLDPADPGKPQYNLPHKCQDQHRPYFPAGQYISVAAGERLRAWAAGEDAPAPPKADGPKVLTPIDRYAKELAEKLKLPPDELRKWWDETAEYRDTMKVPADRLGKMQKAIDAKLGEKADG